MSKEIEAQVLFINYDDIIKKLKERKIDLRNVLIIVNDFNIEEKVNEDFHFCTEEERKIIINTRGTKRMQDSQWFRIYQHRPNVE